MPKKAVVLLSGGLDSATCLALMRAADFDCYAISFDYGQKNYAELTAAKNIAAHLGAKAHRIVSLGIGELGGSALTDSNIAIPDYQDQTAIPSTYVPARNTIFLSIGLGWAEILGATDLAIGVNALDYSGYPDCRPAYIAAFTQLANLATKAGVEGQSFKIHTPLINLHKSAIILSGLKHGVDYSLSVSCYRATEDGKACGNCDACMYRKKGFAEANVPDPTRYSDDSVCASP